MIIHAFGAYFGLAVARVIFQKTHSDNQKEGSLYHSDIFAMIGKKILHADHTMNHESLCFYICKVIV